MEMKHEEEHWQSIRGQCNTVHRSQEHLSVLESSPSLPYTIQRDCELLQKLAVSILLSTVSVSVSDMSDI
jgi:hypothetical protein